MPLRRLADEDEHPVAGRDAVLPQQPRPLRGAPRDLSEGDVAGLPFAVDEPDPELLWILRLDDVAREVEPLRHVPERHGPRDDRR